MSKVMLLGNFESELVFSLFGELTEFLCAEDRAVACVFGVASIGSGSLQEECFENLILQGPICDFGGLAGFS